MGLEINTRDREGITIADLKGRIVMGPEASHFREKIIPLAGDREARVLLNMAQVEYIDSTGLGALVYCASSARKSEGKIKLLDMNARNLELLITTKLETMFETFNDEQDAINSFFPDREIRGFDILEFVRTQEKDEN